MHIIIFSLNRILHLFNSCTIFYRKLALMVKKLPANAGDIGDMGSIPG